MLPILDWTSSIQTLFLLQTLFAIPFSNAYELPLSIFVYCVFLSSIYFFDAMITSLSLSVYIYIYLSLSLYILPIHTLIFYFIFIIIYPFFLFFSFLYFIILDFSPSTFYKFHLFPSHFFLLFNFRKPFISSFLPLLPFLSFLSRYNSRNHLLLQIETRYLIFPTESLHCFFVYFIVLGFCFLLEGIYPCSYGFTIYISS